MSDIAVYWFRDDLRLNDLAGLSAAAEARPGRGALYLG